MKAIRIFALFFYFTNLCIGQIKNPNFHIWDLYNGREKPKEWLCPNLCPSPNCGPCDKINKSNSDFAVRIHNVMPCVSTDNQAKSRNAGFIETYFMPQYNQFSLSFDLTIDAIESPSAFVLTILGKLPSGFSEEVLSWSISETIESRIEQTINLTKDYDSLFIQFKSVGYLKENALHTCDLGYISAIVDNIHTTQIVNTANASLSQMKISPNPFTDRILLSGVASVVEWEVYDLVGKLVHQGFGANVENLDKLDAGIYILQIKESGVTRTFKVVK
ncbi:MAG TPA: T9SS type A sorting domain-containing protein [Saprospiraceae bacterium]|nr:T9SS type A sorting domain-containing protein [Saprospiraceae bacterium]